MTLYYEDEFVTLHHGDCLSETAWLDADVLVTDPPYGRAWKQGNIKEARWLNAQDSDAHAGIANDGDTSARDTAIGVELEERYCELIVKRLSQQAFDFAALEATS